MAKQVNKNSLEQDQEKKLGGLMTNFSKIKAEKDMNILKFYFKSWTSHNSTQNKFIKGELKGKLYEIKRLSIIKMNKKKDMHKNLSSSTGRKFSSHYHQVIKGGEDKVAGGNFDFLKSYFEFRREGQPFTRLQR